MLFLLLKSVTLVVSALMFMLAMAVNNNKQDQL
jgi:hypothetical protein